MDLKELLGDAYKENMTLDEINEALKTHANAREDNLKNMIEKSRFDEVTSQLAASKKELKALKESQMTSEQQLEERLKEAEQMKLGYQREMAKLRAKEVFVSAGLSDKEYLGILDNLTLEDEETAKNAAEIITGLLKAKMDEKEKSVKAEILKTTPKPDGASGANAITLKEFEQMTWQERVALKQENAQLFEELQTQEIGG